MKFTSTERSEYREYAVAAEFWREQGDHAEAIAALHDAIYAAGFDTSELSNKNLMDIFTECHGNLPADPFFLTILTRRATGNNLYRREIAHAFR